MNVVRILVLVAAGMMLGGCFHHGQTAVAEPLPPVAQPIK